MILYSKAIFRFVYSLLLYIFYMLFTRKDIKSIIKKIDDLMFYESKMEIFDKEKIELIKKENERGRGVLIMMNHHSLDSIFLYEFIDFYSVVKSDIMGELVKENEGGNWLYDYIKEEIFERTRAISYSRGDRKSGDEIKKVILQNIQKGRNVMIFPEGRCQHCFKKPNEFKKGIFYLAYEHQIPIFSITVNYSKDIGSNPGEPADIINLFYQRPDRDVYMNGIFYPQYYLSMEMLMKDVYDSISEKVYLEWKE